MAYARTVRAAPGGASGTLTIYALDATWLPSWTGLPPLFGSVSGTLTGPGGTVGLWTERVAGTVGPPPTPPGYQAFPDYEVRLCGAANAGTMPPPTAYIVPAFWDWTGGMPPPQQNVQWTFVGATSAVQACAGAQTGLWLYMTRESIVPEDREPQAPCHPCDFAMYHAWGGDPYEDACTCGIVADAVADKVMVPGPGTTELAMIQVGLGIQEVPPGFEGLVARWTDLTYLGEPWSLEGYSYEGPGVTVVGSGDTMTMTVTDAAGCPDGDNAWEKAPVTVQYDLQALNWGTTLAGLRALVPDGFGGSEAVDLPYTVDRVYRERSWVPGEARPMSYRPLLDATSLE